MDEGGTEPRENEEQGEGIAESPAPPEHAAPRWRGCGCWTIGGLVVLALLAWDLRPWMRATLAANQMKRMAGRPWAEVARVATEHGFGWTEVRPGYSPTTYQVQVYFRSRAIDGIHWALARNPQPLVWARRNQVGKFLMPYLNVRLDPTDTTVEAVY